MKKEPIATQAIVMPPGSGAARSLCGVHSPVSGVHPPVSEVTTVAKSEVQWAGQAPPAEVSTPAPGGAASPPPKMKPQRLLPEIGTAVRASIEGVLRLDRVTLLAAIVLAGVLTVCYWPAMAGLIRRWWNEEDQVHGFLVPAVAIAILVVRREMLAGVRLRGSLWGLPLIVLAGLMRWVSAHYLLALVDPLSLLPLLAGGVLFIGGWRALRWAAPALALLFFMIPLPGLAAGLLSHPLQRAGTIVSTYVLQTLGLPAIALGNVIQLTETQLGVVEACSGLRMMMLFFAVCLAYAFLAKRPALDRVLIIASAVPVSLLANVARIVLTGVLYEWGSRQWGDLLFHDLAGWFMMPLAVLLLWAEMELWGRLLVLPQPATYVPASHLVPWADSAKRGKRARGSRRQSQRG